ncbi:hypothetical protein F1C10_06395 [Sphingomonas sp. NBWT7]|uniref:DUF6438 domain-containing protein n=1 Tax=Sphingomonas sp. NBWT7 TaxID=2596913 RepID=UPI0016298E04|nr:DUF6438 domain-containing protein [Sphingomonas sp. NBWT7]QNE31595.1 hypothetical protein F1C10_06395 [Sphingomonas sp. NBWT7]
MIRRLLLAMSAVLAGCAGNLPAPHSATRTAETITVSVGPCFGFCLVYTVSMAANGEVVFDDARHTAALGERRRKIDAAVYRAIAAELARFRPRAEEQREVACRVKVCDQASYDVTWTGAAGARHVIHAAGGCRDGEGAALEAVLRTLPKRLGIAEWAQQRTYPGTSRG